MNFPNPGDGIQEFTTTIFAQEGTYSQLRSSQEAPLDGYQPEWVQTDNRSLGKQIETNRDPHHNYYFRVRTKEAALDAIPTLIGMGINFSTGKRHNPENKQGIIDSAWIQGQKLCVAGYIFGRDCPSVLKSISACVDAWGMSYELHDAHVDDLYAETCRLNRVTFTGASVILKSEASYKTTEFLLVEL